MTDEKTEQKDEHNDGAKRWQLSLTLLPYDAEDARIRHRHPVLCATAHFIQTSRSKGAKQRKADRR